MSAKSWHSFKDTLMLVLNLIKPKRVLEFGSGESTHILADYQSVSHLHTIENEKEWFDKIDSSKHSNLSLNYVGNLDEYARAFPNESYDLVFIDGRNRAACMRNTRPFASITILHDADREKYSEEIGEYKFKIWTDDFGTVVMTDDEALYIKLSECLKEQTCQLA